jgi:hypothetical protein
MFFFTLLFMMFFLVLRVQCLYFGRRPCVFDTGSILFVRVGFVLFLGLGRRSFHYGQPLHICMTETILVYYYTILYIAKNKIK